MEQKTHWKKLNNPDYLGAYAFNPGEEKVVTIAAVKTETVNGPDGKKEQCPVMHFSEKNVKPLVLNATNAKAIEKLLQTPYLEDWAGNRIQLYVTKVKAFGDVVDAVRVRTFRPRTETEVCNDCKKPVKAYGSMNAGQMADYTRKKYGTPLCAECAAKRKAAEQAAQSEGDALHEND